jgi:transposase, IS605 OrfB family, central region
MTNEIDRKRGQLQEGGDLKSVKLSRERRKYTEYETDRVSREIVDLVSDYDNAGIIMEDLTNYREHCEDPIHDWPYDMIQSKVSYKATGEGIPVEFVDPSYTSLNCRSCDEIGERDGTDFVCSSCGYEVHADVNGAINIARRGFGNF